jgi:hypothetical protein
MTGSERPGPTGPGRTGLASPRPSQSLPQGQTLLVRRPQPTPLNGVVRPMKTGDMPIASYMSSKVCTVYGIFDPFDMSLAYVGRTSGKLSSRLSAHMAAPTNRRMQEWFNALAAAGRKPVIQKLGVCDDSDGRHLEAQMVERYLEAGLLNGQLMP